MRTKMSSLSKLFGTLLLTLIVIISIIKFSMVTKTTERNPPIAKGGVIDLRGWDFVQDGILNLEGEWEYYSEEFISPKDFYNGQALKPEKLYLPGSYGGHSYGTYRLKLLIDDFSTVYSLNIDFIQSAYKLWVGDKEVVSVGQVGANKLNMIPQLLPKNGSFQARTQEIYITLQVSNFFAKHGYIDTISLGEVSQVEQYRKKRLAFDLFLFGCTIMAALYNIALYMSRKKDKAPLYFSIVCILVAIRTMLLGERFLIYLFPKLSYILTGKIMHWTFYLYIPFIIMFMNSFYPGMISKMVLRISNISAIVYAFLVLISPWKFYMTLITPFEILSILLLIYLIFKVSKEYLKTEQSNYLSIVGIFALIITRINDVLYEFSIIITGSFAPLGILIFIITICYIIAERQSLAFSRLEDMSEKLQSLDKLKDDFLAITSHELKTPLNGIIGLTEGLTANKTSSINDNDRENLLLINSSAKRLSNLVEDIMVFSRLKNDNIVLNKKSINIFIISQMVIRFCEISIKGKNIKIINLIDKDVPNIHGDEDRIQQIFYNLLGNAIKFTKEGTIILSYTRKDNFIEVNIEDSGIGIPKEKQNGIFELYGQADGVSEKYGGTGLGLYITRKLVELHGGSISVKSEISKGSKFTISLPICSVDQKELENLYVNSEENVNLTPFKQKDMDNGYLNGSNFPDKESMRILIVDDEYVNQRVLESYLNNESFTILKASNGREALEIINNEALDLVILDMMMPDLSGYEVCTIIREKKSIFELPVLIMTADNRLENLVVSFECGANDYLRKPFNKHELISRVTTLLKLKNSVQEALSLAQRMNIVNKQVEDLSQKNLESTRKVDELLEFDKLKTEFFTNISHELRTPLNVICSTIQLLQSIDPSKQLGDERNKYYLKIMNQNSLRLLRLINNLIDTTRIDGDYLSLNHSYGNIISFIEDIAQSVAEYIKSKNIEIIFDTDVEEKFMAFDEEKIERVILNILSNAVKFTDEYGQILINIEDHNSYITISIKDTGIGIPEEKINYIFERFAQVDRSTTRRTEGSGIGLSLVKALIEMHGGTIYVKSKPGLGSEFVITLPFNEEQKVTLEKHDILFDIAMTKYEKNLSMEFSDIYITNEKTE